MEGIAATGQALTVRYIQKPQDGSADTVIRAGLSPSYVTYNASTVQKVSAFFKTGQVRLPVLCSLGGSAATLSPAWWATLEEFCLLTELVSSMLCSRVPILQWRFLHVLLRPLN